MGADCFANGVVADGERCCRIVPGNEHRADQVASCGVEFLVGSRCIRFDRIDGSRLAESAKFLLAHQRSV